MKYSQTDKNQLDNLNRLLKKATFKELDLMEILAGAQMINWLAGINKQILEDLMSPVVNTTETPPVQVEIAEIKNTKKRAKKSK